MARDFRNIKAWQFADDLTVMVYSVTSKFPREEIYGLTSQLRRAVYSVPANIAEGANRATQKDYLHFLYIAWGSLAETEYFLHLSTRLGYLTETDHQQVNRIRQETSATLNGLIKAVRSEVGIVTKCWIFFLSLIGA
jgi:four helix bundle protein